MAFKLPKLQARMAIVDRLGLPVTSFLRFFNIEFVGAIEAQEARQDAADILIQQNIADIAATQADLVDEINRLNRVLAGTEPFTGINILGTNVQPFLSKTDGDALVDDTGLDTNLISKYEFDEGASPVDVRTTADTIVASVSIFVPVGYSVDISARCGYYSEGNGATIGALARQASIRLDRDGVSIAGTFGAPVINDVQVGITAALPFTDTPPGGSTYTYDLVAVGLSSTADVQDLQAIEPYIRAMRIKL